MVKREKSDDRYPGIIGRFRQALSVVFPDRTGNTVRKNAILSTFIFHFRPRTVPEATLAFNLTWGLGGMAAVLITLQIGTGLLLKFVYEPTPIGAYESILALQSSVVFGQLVRNIHHWSANLLVLIVFLHMLRVFFTGGFMQPRRLNWLVGLVMFAAVLTANFTGYLLPYDQLGYWAVTVSTAMLEYLPLLGIHLQEMVRGGAEVGAPSLRIFFAVHTAVVPALLVVLMGFHFWRIRKAGGLVVPRLPGENPIEIIAAVLVLSVLFNAPLEEPANPGLSPNPTKAPWYFAGLQEMLIHLHPVFAVCVVPLLLTGILAIIPYKNYPADTRGIWFASRLGRRTAAAAALGALVVTPLTILVDDLILEPGKWLTGLPPGIGNGLLPVMLAAGFVIGYYRVLQKRFAATANEAQQAVFVFLVTVFILLTITGVWFRGEGMALTLPF